MSSSMESSKPRKKEGYQNRRPGYYRGNPNHRNSNHYRQQNPETSASSTNLQDSEFNSFDKNCAASTENLGEVNFNRPSNSQTYSKPFRARHQYNSPKHSNYRNYPKEYSNSSTNSSSNNENKDCTEYPKTDGDMPNASQRGKIIGGRYIRKHANQPFESSLRSSDVQYQSDAPERKFHKQYPQGYGRNFSQYETVLQDHTQRSLSSNQHDKDYSYEYEDSRKPSYSSKNFDRKPDTVYSNSNQTTKYRNYSASQDTYNNNKKLFKTSKPALRSLSYDDKATQRELLIHHLHKGECECLVCCELIQTKNQIWHCLSCFHVFHLHCIKKWARSPAAAVEDGSWRCPACQNLTSKVPFNYYCFCGKTKNPEVNYHLTPHSCGEICDRVRPDCSHHCKELCHPGPCPPCAVVVEKSCFCGKTVQTVPCNQTMEGNCPEICDKLLNCGLHRCKNICHDGDCYSCEETVLQKCYCGKNEQEVTCTLDTASCFVYSCENMCSKELNCSYHTCELMCHPGACKPCQLSTEVVKKCACGKSSVAELIAAGTAEKRLSCLDPIPVCGLVCAKTLHCGPKDNPHSCQSPCHTGECPKCPLTTSMKCCCGAFTKEFPCTDIAESFVYTCEKRCNRRKDCGRHKCLNNCCTNSEHRCELVCNKKLSCGQHQCQVTCHMGNCPTCWNVSFDELRCHCGVAVLYPPIHCGTKPPDCSEPCIRTHPCEHNVKHTCHSDENCPPCTSLVTKWCYGKHKQCGPVMCFLDGVSCGMPCDKPLPCGRHKCKLTCHDGGCFKDGEKCVQPCSTSRPSCGHPCGTQCHEGPCPETPCRAQVTLNCPCGHRSETGTCFESAKSYRLMSSTILATKMQEMKGGQSVNLNDVLGKKSKSNKLQCNEECAVIERNKRLAVALQISNPDLSCSPGPPSYSEFVKDEAKKYPHFVTDVYDKISNLVQLAKQSKQKCRSHSFPPMNRDQRRVVHELAEFFGCETQSYDEEPKKNVVVTAYKSKCWLPFIHIMTVVQRDMGFRKGPTPVLAQPKSSPIASAATSISKKKIDYFDYNE